MCTIWYIIYTHKYFSKRRGQSQGDRNPNEEARANSSAGSIPIPVPLPTCLYRSKNPSPGPTSNVTSDLETRNVSKLGLRQYMQWALYKVCSFSRFRMYLLVYKFSKKAHGEMPFIKHLFFITGTLIESALILWCYNLPLIVEGQGSTLWKERRRMFFLVFGKCCYLNINWPWSVLLIVLLFLILTTKPDDHFVQLWQLAYYLSRTV
jgi:hypothetical protein